MSLKMLCAASMLFAATFLSSSGAKFRILNGDMLDGQHASSFASASHMHEGTYVKVSGDTMSGRLNLPADGLAAGTNQLVLSGGRVGTGTATPGQKLTIAGTGAVFGVDHGAEFQGKNSSGTYEGYLWPLGPDDVTYFNSEPT